MPDAPWSASRPWLHLLPDDADIGPGPQHAVVATLSGARMRNVDDLFREFARELRFPEYFGRNWPAFAECVTDLSWLPARAYLLVIKEPALLLEASPPDRDVFYRLIDEACGWWAHSFGLGRQWGGGEVPFNVALLCAEPAREAVLGNVSRYL